MSAPTPDQFEAFYQAVHSHAPFPWQNRLAARVCAGDWPRAIALPTAAGKTACIDIAVFALACGVTAIRQPRRIFFVVDRRIVVDQAFDHAKNLADKLDRASDGVLLDAADALRDIAEPGWLQLDAADRLRILGKRWAIKDAKDEVTRRKLLQGLEVDEREWFEVSPLDVYALRGGMYRESAWARSPLQPAVIASTVDQVGSRLLFRGYGVSDSMRPIHAGLVGNDSLILLDEAHCAKPFDQTMQAIEKYRAWGQKSDVPFRFVSVTATPTEDIVRAEKKRQGERPTEPKLIEEAGPDDLSHSVLGKRISASKPATLVVAEKAKGKSFKQWGKPLVEKLAEEAKKLSAEFACVGIIVNRVATARALEKELGDGAVLLTGRMRPLDRDRIFAGKLQPLLSGASGAPPKFVVGTQCLECGADFDFHALVTECASLDALRQRFGRLNRIAAREVAKAVVVVRADQTEPAEKESDRDPVYGDSLANTWRWLNSKAPSGVFDFGVSAVREATTGVDLGPLNAPSPDAPVLFPAHLDCWVQTHPIPTPDPDPALFLHGPKQSGQPDVQVVFRDDLGENADLWAEIVGLCPPSSSEAVAVPIGVFRKWMADELRDDETADVEGGAPEEAEEFADAPRQRTALRWRGPEESEPISDPKDVTPNDTYVIRVPREGDSRELDAVRKIADLGETVRDYSEEAFQHSRDKALLRLPTLAIPEDADKYEEAELVSVAIDALRTSLAANAPDWRMRAAEYFAEPKNLKRREVDRHPLGGVVVTGTARLHRFDPTHLDDSEPAESFKGARASGRAVTLEEHSRGVADHAARFAAGCDLDVALFTQAGLWHDVGKLDPRFQAMLRQSSPRTAVGEPLAKSGKRCGTKRERDEAREVHKYPVGARHELLSAALVSARAEEEPGGGADDLLLHLIATHHGSARPFASAVDDEPAPDATWPFGPELFDETFPTGSYHQQIREWNAELPERFWRVVRTWGWWGAAYREAVFRLADHAQSAAEQERDAAPAVATGWVSLPSKVARPDSHTLPLTGLDGANPLAFLAALGTLRLADRRYPGTRLSWEVRGYWVPILHLPQEITQQDLITNLLAQADRTRRCVTFSQDIKILATEFRTFELEACRATLEDGELAEFLPAYGNPLITIQGGPNAGKTKPTEFYFIAGQQKLLKQAREIATLATEEHLAKALFEYWAYDDPLDGLSLRWDPRDDLRYATRFHNPSKDKSKGKRGSVLGANRLAFEALPLFPCLVQGERLVTTGFMVIDRRPFFTWPIWGPAWSVNTVRSALTSLVRLRKGVELQQGAPQLGVIAWYQCEKVANSDYSNFTPSRLV